MDDVRLHPVLAGHLLVAIGVLPGYRGVWRAMHLAGRVPVATARRIWPGWAERVSRSATDAESTRVVTRTRTTAGDDRGG
jgi:hypothetical protein